LVGWLAGWLAGLADWLRDDDLMPVTATGATGSYSAFSFSLSLSFPFVPLSVRSRDIYIGRPGIADSARVTALFSAATLFTRW